MYYGNGILKKKKIIIAEIAHVFLVLHIYVDDKGEIGCKRKS